MNHYEIRHYETTRSHVPFQDWLQSLRDGAIRSRILSRLDRMQLGLFGDHKSVGQSVFEAKFHFGSGYRVYFAFANQKLILLLCGGDKDSQTRDIVTAQAYWWDYKRRNNL